VTRAILLLSLLLPSLAGAQGTAIQRNGLVLSLKAAIQTVADGTPPTVIAGTRLQFGGNVAAGGICIRGTLHVDDADIRFLGLSPAAFPTEADRYVAAQICAPGTSAVDQEIPSWLRDMAETWGAVFTSAQVFPRVILATRNDALAKSAVTGFACACSSGASCNWTPPLQGGGFGASTAAPKGMTLPKGLWSGSGCVFKTCLELYGFSSWPPECPNQ
jgi:hypothetical protein